MRDDIKGYIAIGGLVCAVGLVLTWVFMEFLCTRSFVGTCIGKYDEYSYSHDERRTVITTDKDGDTHVSHRGSDRTTATKRYIIAFDCDGTRKNITAGSYSASVPYVRSDDRAREKLAVEHTEPGLYTHAKIKTQYLVVVRGWLFDGTLEDLTDLATMKAE